MTQAGMILGTAAYMSPEQARGKPIDTRTDVWAFGCVLFEMLTGQRAFEGELISDVLAAILKTDPNWQAMPAGAGLETAGRSMSREGSETAIAGHRRSESSDRGSAGRSL